MTVMDQAVQVSLPMVASGNITTYRRNDKHPMLPDINIQEETSRELSLCTGWGRLQKQRDTLEQNTIHIYCEEAIEIWHRGNYEGAKKMCPSEIHRSLKMNHPDRLDIPAVHHITNYIYSLN